MMPQQVITEDEFAALTTALATEVQAANIDYRMYRNLSTAFEQNESVYNQSRAFWGLTLDAHLNSAVLRVCRIYDRQRSSLNLEYWLKVIKSHPGWFTQEKFEQRRTTPLTQYHGAPAPQELDAYITLTGPSNPLVKNLVVFRNSLVGHLGVNYVVRRHGARESFQLTWGDIGTLIETSLSILNNYMTLYNGHSYSPNMVGADDYTFIIERLSDAIRRTRDDEGQ